MAYVGQKFVFDPTGAGGVGGQFVGLTRGQGQTMVGGQQFFPHGMAFDGHADQVARGQQNTFLGQSPTPFGMAIVKPDKAPQPLLKRDGRHQQGLNPLGLQLRPLGGRQVANQAVDATPLPEHLHPGGYDVVHGPMHGQVRSLLRVDAG